ncbi:TIGR03546 family protein [bacterium]|nr:TIGR03546 family protein [bacterium]
MIFLKLLSKLVSMLRSGDSAWGIAWGFSLGAVLGLTPFLGLHTAVVVLLVCVLRVNVSAALFAWLLFGAVAWVLDPVFHSLGYFVLTGIPALEPLWTNLYNAPVAPLTRFNNTVMMGSWIVSLLLLVPNTVLFRAFVLKYRASWNAKIARWKWVRAAGASGFVQTLWKIRGWEV